MIEKLVTIPAKAGYSLGKFGIEKGAQAGSRLLPALRDYMIPAAQSVDDIDYYSKIEKKNKDIAKYIEKNPDKKQTLEDCLQKTVESNRTARNWAATIDTLDKSLSAFGFAGDYLILMTGTVGYTLGLAEEAVEMALLKGPFMAYYAKKNGMKRIPGWLAYEFFSHILPFGDLLDWRNNYVKAVDKDIVNNAANLFREHEELAKPAGWLSGLWNKTKSYFSTPKVSKHPAKEVPVAVDTPVVPLPNPDKEAPLIPLPRYDPRDEAPLIPLPNPDFKEDRIYVDDKGLFHVIQNGVEKVYNCNGIIGPVAPGEYPNGKYELMAKPVEQNIEQKVAA